MQKYKINSMFYSLQGEGPSVGHVALFIRFAGCTLNCSFCDTNHEEKEEVTLAEIQERIRECCLPQNTLCVLTGGEPLLQVDHELIEMINSEGLLSCLETSGDTEALSRAISARGDMARTLQAIHEVVVSPKNKNVSEFVISYATTLKVLVPFPGSIKEKDVLGYAERLGEKRVESKTLEFVLQPLTIQNPIRDCREISTSASSLAARYQHSWVSKTNNEWRVIPQCHVPMQLR